MSILSLTNSLYVTGPFSILHYYKNFIKLIFLRISQKILHHFTELENYVSKRWVCRPSDSFILWLSISLTKGITQLDLTKKRQITNKFTLIRYNRDLYDCFQCSMLKLKTPHLFLKSECPPEGIFSKHSFLKWNIRFVNKVYNRNPLFSYSLLSWKTANENLEVKKFGLYKVQHNYPNLSTGVEFLFLENNSC